MRRDHLQLVPDAERAQHRGVGHGQQVGLVELEVRVELVAELVAGATGAGARRVAALDHEAVDDAVEHDAVVKAVIGQFGNPRDMVGREIAAQLDDNIAAFAISGVERQGKGFGKFGHGGSPAIIRNGPP